MKKKLNKTGGGVVAKTARYVVMFLGALFVIVNLVVSQTIPSLYPRFVENEKDAAAEYLMSIRKLPLFSAEYLTYKNKYGRSLEEKVMKEEVGRAQEETILLDFVKMVPGSPELFARLSLLYRQGGNDLLSDEYASKATDLDPGIITKIK